MIENTNFNDAFLPDDYVATKEDFIKSTQEIPDLMELIKNVEDKYQYIANLVKLGEKIVLTHSYLYNLNMKDCAGMQEWLSVYLGNIRQLNNASTLEKIYNNNEMPFMPEQKDQSSN